MTRRRAFTLMELLVVIAIIGILAALLLPVLSKSKNQAAKTTDINNLKQTMMAVHLYASDDGDGLPPPNWDGGQGAITGWLYKPAAPGTNSFVVQTGLLWATLGNTKLYLCPMDNPSSAAFGERAATDFQLCNEWGGDWLLFRYLSAGEISGDAPNRLRFLGDGRKAPGVFQ